jgi:hypothetical protein
MDEQQKSLITKLGMPDLLCPSIFPDPTLPAGTLKQVDWAAPGINASFVNVIKDKDGKLLEKISTFQITGLGQRSICKERCDKPQYILTL